MKTMQFVMPFFILFIGWNFTSGLVLYWIVSSGFQAVQQYFVTGWGSLLTVPNLIPKSEGNASSNNNTANTKVVNDSAREKTDSQSANRLTIERMKMKKKAHALAQFQAKSVLLRLHS